MRNIEINIAELQSSRNCVFKTSFCKNETAEVVKMSLLLYHYILYHCWYDDDDDDCVTCSS